MTKINKIIEFLETLDCDLDFEYHLSKIDEIESFEDIRQAIECDNGFDTEVIYHSVAMEYLSENDPSLNESCRIASELGYSVENINSELLASLLKSQTIRDDFENLENDIESFLYELEEKENEG